MAQARVEAFLRGASPALGLVGPPGSGKLHGCQLAAGAAGFQIVVLDRSQGPIHYQRLGGASALGGDGLAKSMTVVCCADAETSWPDPRRLPAGTKMVWIGNHCRAAMKTAGITVEQVSRPTADAMAKHLFHESGGMPPSPCVWRV